MYDEIRIEIENEYRQRLHALDLLFGRNGHANGNGKHSAPPQAKVERMPKATKAEKPTKAAKTAIDNVSKMRASGKTIDRARAYLGKHRDPFTAKDLGGKLEVSNFTASAIVAEMFKSGELEKNGTRSTGGVPAQIYRPTATL